MNRRTFERAREVADASGLLAKAASISEARGLTGAAAVEHAAGLYLNAVDQVAASIDSGADQERARIFAILDHPAARADYEEAKRLALETDTPVDAAVESLQAKQTEAAVARASEILGGSDNG